MSAAVLLNQESMSIFVSALLPCTPPTHHHHQAQANESRRSKLTAERVQADDKVAVVSARLPELEAEKRAAAAKKVCVRSVGGSVCICSLPLVQDSPH